MRHLLSLFSPVALVLSLGLPVLRGLGQPPPQPMDRLIEYPEELTDETIRRLDKWVKRTGEHQPPSLLRDIFGREAVVAPSPPPAALPLKRTQARTGPVLRGFVFTRGQGPPQPKAAIDYEGQMFLVDLGDTVGPYRVERIEEGDSVWLVDDTTAEKLQLILN